MAASSTCCSISVSNISLLSARCTGFAKVKGRNDYAFIIDLEWSDDRSMSIKRTYSEFQAFHNNLTKVFPELKQAMQSKLRLQTSKYTRIATCFYLALEPTTCYSEWVGEQLEMIVVKCN